MNKMNERKLTRNDSIWFSVKIAGIIGISLVLLGGALDWIYLNSQELAVNFFDAQASYLESYISGFIISIVEIAAALYFLQRYDLGGKVRSFFLGPTILGVAASILYVLAEFVSAIRSINGSANLNASQIIMLELPPNVMDYGNAVIIGFSVFCFIFLLRVLFRLNPLSKVASMRHSSNNNNLGSSFPARASGVLGGIWAGFITTASATLCCGPLPGFIAVASGISTIYFSSLINLQPYLALVGLPLLVFAIILADRRARTYCKLR
jgi:hypothetical protein